MVIFRVTDRIPVKVGEVTFYLAPLSHLQKARIAQFQTEIKGESFVDRMRLTEEVLAFSVKRVDGLQNPDGSPYQVCFAGPDSDRLTSDCVADLMSMEAADKLIRVCTEFVFFGIKDPGLEGVEVDLKNVRLPEKKIPDPSPVH